MMLAHMINQFVEKSAEITQLLNKMDISDEADPPGSVLKLAVFSK